MTIGGLVSKDHLVFVYILDLLTTDGFASFEGVGALQFGIVSDPGPCWPSSCFLTTNENREIARCSGRYVKDGGRPEWCNKACKEFSKYQTSKTHILYTEAYFSWSKNKLRDTEFRFPEVVLFTAQEWSKFESNLHSHAFCLSFLTSYS